MLMRGGAPDDVAEAQTEPQPLQASFFRKDRLLVRQEIGLILVYFFGLCSCSGTWVSPVDE
jgi:hypothetical protein